MATKESCAATEERDLNLGSKQQVIEPYMFEPNKGDQGEGTIRVEILGQMRKSLTKYSKRLMLGVVLRFNGASAVNVR